MEITSWISFPEEEKDRSSNLLQTKLSAPKACLFNIISFWKKKQPQAVFLPPTWRNIRYKLDFCVIACFANDREMTFLLYAAVVTSLK